MKRFFLILPIAYTLLAGCSGSTLESPPVIAWVELNTDSFTTVYGKYVVCLKAEKGTNPFFYTNKTYSSGETLVPMSQLQSIVDKKMNAYIDTISSKDRQISKLKIEKETIEQTVNEKATLIRFLTGK